MNRPKSILPDGINQYKVSPLKLKLNFKHKMLILTFAVSMYFRTLRRPSPYIFDIVIISFSADQSLKTWLRKLRTTVLPVYFMILNFDYGIQLSIIHVSKYFLMPVTFCPSVVILRGGVDGDRKSIPSDTLVWGILY